MRSASHDDLFLLQPVMPAVDEDDDDAAQAHDIITIFFFPSISHPRPAVSDRQRR